jgi:DNA-binding NarL/FixJ family response regulator
MPTAEHAVRVVVVDDQQLIRDGISILLDREVGITVVATAGDGLEALDVVRRLMPDVVVLDVRMPGMDGVDTARRLVEFDPAISIVALTTFPHDDAVIAMLRAGASQVVGKDATAAELAAAIVGAYGGATAPALHRAASPDVSLTPREVEIARLVCQGLRNGDIAEHLGLGLATVKTHLNNLRAKIGAESRRDIATYAAQRGLLDT